MKLLLLLLTSQSPGLQYPLIPGGTGLDGWGQPDLMLMQLMEMSHGVPSLMNSVIILATASIAFIR